MTTWFTADHHFGHSNIIQYANRPFEHHAEMDGYMIDQWNNQVKTTDTVYHVGDFTLGSAIAHYVNQLNGSIYIVPGGHDFRWQEILHKDCPVSKSGIDLFVLPPLYTLDIGTSKSDRYIIVLCHYAMRVWDRSHYGSYHLYGHSHGTLPGLGRSMDVGVDTNNFKLYSLQDVIDRLSDVEIHNAPKTQ